MELHSVPKKVLVGTSLEDAMANVSATITFETGITKEVMLLNSDLWLFLIWIR